MTALDQFAAKIHLAKTEPSTHDPKRTLGKIPWGRRHVQNSLSFFQQSFGTWARRSHTLPTCQILANSDF